MKIIMLLNHNCIVILIFYILIVIILSIYLFYLTLMSPGEFSGHSHPTLGGPASNPG